MANFLENFLANLFADTIVAIVIGLVIAKYLDYKEKKKEKAEKEKQRKQKLQVAAGMIWREIEHNRKQLKIMIKELSVPNLPYPALEISAWEIIDKDIYLEGLKLKDFSDLVNLYNRFKTINMMYYTMLDKINWIEAVYKKPVVQKQFMDSLISRCKEALSYLEEIVPEDLKKTK